VPDATGDRDGQRDERLDGAASSTQPRRTDERAAAQRAGARRLDTADGRVRPAYAPRPGAAPGQYDDEFLANDEPEYDERSARWGFGRLFARN
jgi:hypothetical protein